MFRHPYEANTFACCQNFYLNSSGALKRNQNKTKQKNMKAKREKLLSFATIECKKKECKNH